MIFSKLIGVIKSIPYSFTVFISNPPRKGTFPHPAFNEPSECGGNPSADFCRKTIHFRRLFCVGRQDNKDVFYGRRPFFAFQIFSSKK
jgi:hypothetical protein